MRALQSSIPSVPMTGLEVEETVESMGELTGSPGMDHFSGQFSDVDVDMDSASPGKQLKRGSIDIDCI